MIYSIGLFKMKAIVSDSWKIINCPHRLLNVVIIFFQIIKNKKLKNKMSNYLLCLIEKHAGKIHVVWIKQLFKYIDVLVLLHWVLRSMECIAANTAYCYAHCVRRSQFLFPFVAFVVFLFCSQHLWESRE